MAELNPWAIIRVASDQQAFGRFLYDGDDCTWPLVAMQGRPGASYQGLVEDPTGDYMMQARVTAWLDSDHTQGTSAGGTFGDGKDLSVQKLDGTNPKVLRQTATGGSDFTFTAAFLADESRRVRLYIPATTTASTPSLYAYFNTTLRLAFEAGQPIRLQGPDATAPSGWTNLATSGLGECEAYLDSCGRFVDVDVLAQTDAGWDPSYAQYSDAPPSRILVTLNGEDTLPISASTLPAGQVRIVASNRQWGALIGRGRHALTARVITPYTTHPVEFQGSPVGDFMGYVPAYFYGGGISISVNPGASLLQAQAVLSLDATAGVDATGYPMRSVYLSALTAEFPAAWEPPQDEPDWAYYLCDHARAELSWDQANSLGRASGEVTFVLGDASMAPGAGVAVAARAFQLFMGVLPDGEAPTPDNLNLVMTGYTSLSAAGIRWRVEGGLTYVTIPLNDRLIKADKACLYMPAGDGSVHYWVMRNCAHRCGFTDEHLGFPVVSRHQPGEYQLSYGTAQNPKFQPHPADQLLGHMLEVRADSGDVDPTTGQIQPMVLGTDNSGVLQYFPMPVGVVQSFLDPGQDPAVYGLIAEQEFSSIPLFNDDGTPALNEMLDFLETFAALDQIRNAAVFAGLDTATGGEVVGAALNPQLITDPNAFGYIGAVSNAYVQISRRISSLPVAQRQAALAQVLLAFPAIRAALIGHLQPFLQILSVVSIQNYAAQGTDQKVGYYVTSAIHEMGTNADGTRYGLSHLGGKLLGQAGD